MTGTTTSCPRCGVDAPAAASRCLKCGFVFFEASARRSLPRPSPLWMLVALLVLGAGGTIALLMARDPRPEPLAPVPRARAEQRLERQLRAAGVADERSVRCHTSVRPGQVTRCELHYTDGDTQLLLVNLTAAGKLDIDNPYPAQRRPGG